MSTEVITEVASNYEAFKYIGVGLCSLGMAGAALGVGNIFGSYFNSIARNPSVEPKIKTYLFVGFALAESLGIFAVLLGFMIINN